MESELKELLKHPEFRFVKEKTIDYSGNTLAAKGFSSNLMMLEASVAVLNRNNFGGLSNRSQMIFYDEFKEMEQVFQERKDNPKNLSIIAAGNFMSILPYLKDTFWREYGNFQHYGVEPNYDEGACFNLVLDPKEQVLYVFEKPSRNITKLEFW